jgi:hypothetical protein
MVPSELNPKSRQPENPHHKSEKFYTWESGKAREIPWRDHDAISGNRGVIKA